MENDANIKKYKIVSLLIKCLYIIYKYVNNIKYEIVSNLSTLTEKLLKFYKTNMELQTKEYYTSMRYTYFDSV